MYKQGIKIFLERNTELIRQNYKHALKDANPEAIHDLRVSIKRINALVKLLNYNKNTNFRLKDNISSLMLIFKSAGPLRDLQVMEELLHKYRANFELIDNLLIKQAVARKMSALKEFVLLFKAFNYFDVIRLFRNIENHILRINENFILTQVEGLRSSQLSLLTEFSNPDSVTYNLHSARKIIKDIAYLNEMNLEEKDESGIQYILFREAGACLGEWHDRMVLLKFLKLKTNNFHLENENLQILKKQVAREKKALKQNYFSMLHSILETN